MSAIPPIHSSETQRSATKSLRVLALPGFAPRDNPYTRLLYEGVAASGAVVQDFSWRAALTDRWDVIHLHWPEYMLRSRKMPWLSGPRRLANRSVLKAAKQRGTKLFWTVHNLKPHGMPTGVAWQPYADFLELVDGLFFLSEESRRLFHQLYPASKKLPDFVTPHGFYDDVYPSGVTREVARSELGIPDEAVVAASIGGVQRYKNLTTLIEQQARLGRRDLWVLIAGKPADSAIEAELSKAAAGSLNVRLHLRFLADDELQTCFAAADFCVAPYRDILNSGAVLLAMTFGRPVLCPAIGSLVELQKIVGEEWIKTYQGDFTATALESGIAWSQQTRPASPDVPAMRWDQIGRQTLAAYYEVTHGNVRTSDHPTVDAPTDDESPRQPANQPSEVAAC